jgi:hypothetical protein
VGLQAAVVIQQQSTAGANNQRGQAGNVGKIAVKRCIGMAHVNALILVIETRVSYGAAVIYGTVLLHTSHALPTCPACLSQPLCHHKVVKL